MIESRTYDSHLIHCNVSTDVMISDSQEPPICTLLSNLIENFSLGQRRLHLFAKPGDERPGWITVGRDFESTNFDCKRYLRTWGESGRQGWLTTFDPGMYIIDIYVFPLIHHHFHEPSH